MLDFLKKFILVFLMLVCVTPHALAAEDPLLHQNNFFGIHILFPSELDEAHQLVNSSGGDWGYVTIPIQIGDTDIDKWQSFMNDCARFHLIPILRLATEANWENTSTWRKPNDADIVDMANFLSSLTWPTKNQYIILFNEVNRYDEWGGDPPDAANYASLVSFAVDTFKARSQNFFIIMGGLDNAAPNDGVKYVSDQAFLEDIASFNPGVFDKIDGFASHSYPNPNFAAFPSATNPVGVATYRTEYAFINSYTHSKKPAFITETGWDSNYLTDKTVAFYFQKTINDIWNQDRDKIVAITPFLLQSGNTVFDKFAFIKNGHHTAYYDAFQAASKVKGQPDTNLMPSPIITPAPQVLGVKTFNIEPTPQSRTDAFVLSFEKMYVKSLLGYGTLW